MLASQLGALGGLAGAAGLNIKNPTDTYVALFKSRTVADRLIDRFDLMNAYQQTLRQNARAALEGATKVSSGKDGLITIQVDDKDPKRAADIANAYVQELSKLTGSLAITEAQQRARVLREAASAGAGAPEKGRTCPRADGRGREPDPIGAPGHGRRHRTP